MGFYFNPPDNLRQVSAAAYVVAWVFDNFLIRWGAGIQGLSIVSHVIIM